MIKAIIFDCFSVLIGDATKMMSSELWHKDPAKGEQYRSVSRAMDKGVLGVVEGNEILAELLGVSYDELIDIRNKGEVRNIELLNYIENSLKGNYKLAVLSNISSRARLDSRFLPGELERIFDVVIASGDVGHIKPYPEIFQITLDQLGVAPEECVMIDDIQEFCDGAKAVGINAIQFSSNSQAIADLQALIDRGGERE